MPRGTHPARIKGHRFSAGLWNQCAAPRSSAQLRRPLQEQRWAGSGHQGALWHCAGRGSRRSGRAGRRCPRGATAGQGKASFPPTRCNCMEMLGTAAESIVGVCRAQKDLSGMENKDKNQVIECCIIKTWQNFCRVMKVIVSEISETPVLCWLVQDHLCKLAFLTVACPVISLEHFQTHGSLYFYAEWWDKILKTWSRKLVFEWCYVSI